MELVEERRSYTIAVSEKEYNFIKWCIDNKDAIDIVKKPTKLKLGETPKKVKQPVVFDEDELPF